MPPGFGKDSKAGSVGKGKAIGVPRWEPEAGSGKAAVCGWLRCLFGFLLLALCWRGVGTRTREAVGYELRPGPSGSMW